MINRRMVYFHERNWTRPIASVPYLCRTHIPIRKLNSVNFAFVKWLRLQHFKNSIVLIWPCHKTSKQILIPLILQSWNTVNVPKVLNWCRFFLALVHVFFFLFFFSVTYIDCDSFKLTNHLNIWNRWNFGILYFNLCFDKLASSSETGILSEAAAFNASWDNSIPAAGMGL